MGREIDQNQVSVNKQQYEQTEEQVKSTIYTSNPSKRKLNIDDYEDRNKEGRSSE